MALSPRCKLARHLAESQSEKTSSYVCASFQFFIHSPSGGWNPWCDRLPAVSWQLAGTCRRYSQSGGGSVILRGGCAKLHELPLPRLLTAALCQKSNRNPWLLSSSAPNGLAGRSVPSGMLFTESTLVLGFECRPSLSAVLLPLLTSQQTLAAPGAHRTSTNGQAPKRVLSSIGLEYHSFLGISLPFAPLGDWVDLTLLQSVRASASRLLDCGWRILQPPASSLANLP